MANEKMTRALAGRLARSKGRPVTGVLFAALETEKLPLSSFAARAAARDREVKEKLSRIMAGIQQWEAARGQQVQLEVRPDDASIVVTAPADFFTSLAEDAAVVAVDVVARKT
ncbi:MAG: hypothetical protein ACRDI2_03940 [Chloroflexota bacterium]